MYSILPFCLVLYIHGLRFASLCYERERESKRMLAIMFVVILVALAASALKWGVDSREGINSRQQVHRQV